MLDLERTILFLIALLPTLLPALAGLLRLLAGLLILLTALLATLVRILRLLSGVALAAALLALITHRAFFFVLLGHRKLPLLEQQ